jgi:uncharacterized protein
MTEIIKVVFDTQIFVRALINRTSAPGRIVFDLNHQFELHLTQKIEQEVFDVLSRPKIRAKYPQINDAAVQALKTQLRSVTSWITISEEDIEPVCRDPKDDIFLACAKVAGAAYLISEDQDLLVLKQHYQTQIVNVGAFLTILESRT